MTKRRIEFFILITIIGITFLGCDLMATLFHGEKPPNTYTVTFNANNAIGTPPEEQTVNAGTVIILPDKGGMTSTGNIFVGWNESASGGGTTYSVGASVTVTRNMVFYAQWLDATTPQYTVTFNANGATSGSAPASQTAYRGISITIPSQGTLAYSGKTFGGWNTQNNGGGTNYAVGATFTVTENVTLYAKWQSAVQYTVTYNANGASGVVPLAQTVDPGTEITLPSVGNLTYTGKKFIEWNTQTNGNGTSYAEGATYIVNANVTLYAKWQDLYTVTFNANGASGAVPTAQTVDPGTVITLPGVGSMSNIGKTFEGWNTNAGGTGTDYAEGASYTVNANTTFYAKWLSVPIEPPGATLVEKLAYIANQFDNGTVYNIVIENDEYITPTSVSTMGQNVIINLYSISSENIKTIAISTSTGYLFNIASNIKLNIRNIILKGSNTNNVALVRVGTGGTLVINTGAEITGNKINNWDGSAGAGILVQGGTVTIFDGKIWGNENYAQWGSNGGGIYITTGGTVTMYGGIIYANKAAGNNPGKGAGIFIASGGHFTKTPLSSGIPCGIIYGRDAAAELANRTADGIYGKDGNGDAVFYSGSTNKQRNTTIGGFDVISTENINLGWE